MNITGFRYTVAPNDKMRLYLYGPFSYQEAELFGKMMREVLTPILQEQGVLLFVLEEYACSLKAQEEFPEGIARYQTGKYISRDFIPTHDKMKELIIQAELMTRTKISEMNVQPGSPTPSTRGWSPMNGVGDSNGG